MNEEVVLGVLLRLAYRTGQPVQPVLVALPADEVVEESVPEEVDGDDVCPGLVRWKNKIQQQYGTNEHVSSG